MVKVEGCVFPQIEYYRRLETGIPGEFDIEWTRERVERFLFPSFEAAEREVVRLKTMPTEAHVQGAPWPVADFEQEQREGRLQQRENERVEIALRSFSAEGAPAPHPSAAGNAGSDDAGPRQRGKTIKERIADARHRQEVRRQRRAVTAAMSPDQAYQKLTERGLD